jgi:hypothetical protein
LQGPARYRFDKLIFRDLVAPVRLSSLIRFGN